MSSHVSNFTCSSLIGAEPFDAPVLIEKHGSWEFACVQSGLRKSSSAGCLDRRSTTVGSDSPRVSEGGHSPSETWSSDVEEISDDDDDDNDDSLAAEPSSGTDGGVSVEWVVPAAAPDAAQWFYAVFAQPVTFFEHPVSCGPTLFSAGAGEDVSRSYDRRKKAPWWKMAPGGADSAEGSEGGIGAAVSELTTIVLRNLPSQYTRAMLFDLLDSQGFTGRFDFLYRPANLNTGEGFTYAFVNLMTHADAQRAQQRLDGFSEWGVPCTGSCKVSWSDQVQGFAANVARYRDSPLMHESVRDEHKPIVLSGGARQPFPAPLRKIKAPQSVRRTTPTQATAR